MPADYRRIADFLRSAVAGQPADAVARLRPKDGPSPPRVTSAGGTSPEAIGARWALPELPPSARDVLFDASARQESSHYEQNIEQFIGIARLPIGLAGPLRVNGLFAQGDYYLPLATTEATLVASYARGARILTESGGCTTLVVNEGVTRAPGFAFESLVDAGLFVVWVTTHLEDLREAAARTTRHGRLIDMEVTLEGNHVYLGFEFTTGDASGQNMVTLATEAICHHIVAQSPVTPRYHFLEANLSGDKKATARSFLSVRGRKVTAEVKVPAAVVEQRLHTTAARLTDYWRMSALGGVMSGSLGVQGHYANGLAALFIACGQDAATVAEAAVGITRFEHLEDGSLYAAVTLPNLIVGTVGGGTSLPTPRACLDILGLAGPGHARALAEVTAAAALAGELSITGALAAGHFAEAHRRLARGGRDTGATADPQAT